MHLRALGLVSASAAFLACAHKPEVYPNDRFVLDTQRERIEARIDPSGINGTMILLAQDEESLKGVAFNQPVFLYWTEGRASGLVANLPVELTVTRRDQSLRARGLYTGAPVDLTVSPNEISGIIRGCSYWLKGSKAAFEGFRQCDFKHEQESTTVNVPGTLQSKPDAEKMVILAFLLSQ